MTESGEEKRHLASAEFEHLRAAPMSKLAIQQEPRPSSVAARIMWSMTIAASVSRWLRPSLRTQASPGTPQTQITMGA